MSCELCKNSTACEKCMPKWEEEFYDIVGKIPDQLTLEKFGKKFCFMCGSPTRGDITVEKIKYFISSLLISEREKVIKEFVEGLVPYKHELGQTRILDNSDREYFKEGFNQAIDEIQEKINNKLKEICEK